MTIKLLLLYIKPFFYTTRIAVITVDGVLKAALLSTISEVNCFDLASQVQITPLLESVSDPPHTRTYTHTHTC